MKDTIIEKYKELIATYENQPDDSDERDYYLWDKRIRELTKELSALQSEEQPKAEANGAEWFVKNKLNEKTGQGITLYEHYLAHDTTISIGTAVSWMHEYATQPLPSDTLRNELIAFASYCYGHGTDVSAHQINEYIKSITK